MKVLAFAASNSRKSINRALVEHAASCLQAEVPPGAEVEFLDFNDCEMPIFSVDRERESGIPAEARAFFDKIGAADAVPVSFEEHDGSVTAAWKNIFDWMSRIDMKLWQGEPLVMLAATQGPRAGTGVIDSQEIAAPFFGAEIRGKHGIGKWSEAWEAETRNLTRREGTEALRHALDSLALETV